MNVDDCTPVVVAAQRTAVGAFLGAMRKISSAQLGAVTLDAVLAASRLDADDVDDVIMGNVLQAGSGLNPARHAALAAAIPVTVPAMTINKACGSGLKAVALAAQAIAAGDAEVVLAGGMESMSQAPYLLPGAREGLRLGHGDVVDSILRNGLWDEHCGCHMGMTAENLADRYSLDRREQDDYALQSQHRCQAAIRAGRFITEICPISLVARDGKSTDFTTDEHPRSDLSIDDLGRLRPVFKADGTVTAGNASGINDGAAAVMVTSYRTACQRDLSILAAIRGTAVVGVEPSVMGIGPAGAIRALLARHRLALADIDLLEVNEAFAAQTLAVARELEWDANRVNVNGGAIALGHPIGATGARILVTLIHELARRDGRYGVAALCIGGGMGIAMLVERIER